jgi:DNA-binding CsgD family transcriptional regulator
MGIPTKVVSDLEERLATLQGATRALDPERRAALEDMRRTVRGLRQLGEALTRLRQNGAVGRRPRVPLRPRENSVSAFGLADKFGLSLRELEVALLLAEGRSNREIAQAVRVSTHTARHHTQHVLGKLGVRRRTRAAALINDFLGGTRTER